VNKAQTFRHFIIALHKGFRWKLYALIIFGLLNSLLQGIGVVMIIPLLEFYNNKSGNLKDISSILPPIEFPSSLEGILIMYVVILVSFGLFRSLYMYYSKTLIADFNNSFNTKSFSNILKANWTFHTQFSPSQLINLFNTESKSVRALSYQFFQFIQSSFLTVIQLGLATLISWKITLGTLLVLGIFYLLIRVFFRKTFEIGKNRVGLNEQMQLLLSQTFNALKFIKIHHRESLATTEYANRVNHLFGNEKQAAKLEGITQFIYILFGAFVITGVVYIGLHFKLTSVTTLLVLLILLSRSLSQFQSLSKSVSGIFNQLPAFKRFFEITKKAKALQKASKSNESIGSVSKISLDSISFGYEKEQPVLNNFSAQFFRGNAYLFFGKSGSGKTTTLDIIAGLIQPQEGEILFEDQNQLPNSISYVLQDNILFEGTIQQNITQGKEFSKNELESTINQSGLSQLIKNVGLNFMIQEGGKGLSGGEKQRIALARALITNPSILLLDEFTSALDAATETEILKSIQEIKKEKIVIIVAHREYIKDWVDGVIEF